MLRTIVENLYIVPIMAMMFMLLYMLGGEDIIFFQRKKLEIDPKSNEKLTAALEKYARTRDCKVLGRTTIEFEGKTMTFDAILLDFFGTVAFKAAGHGGEIYADLGSEEWVQIFEGKRNRFYSPVMAMNGSSRLFRDLYRAENVKAGQSDSLVVFTNKYCNVAVARTLPVCHIRELTNKLSDKKYTADNGADIDAMAAALAKYSK